MDMQVSDFETSHADHHAKPILSSELTNIMSKRHLLLRCQSCRELLPAVHFHCGSKTLKNAEHLVCLACKRMCISCGLRLPQESFSVGDHNGCVTSPDEGETGLCDKCLAKQQVAQTNVYFKYPVLKYKACPFSPDSYRDRSKPK